MHSQLNKLEQPYPLIQQLIDAQSLFVEDGRIHSGHPSEYARVEFFYRDDQLMVRHAGIEVAYLPESKKAAHAADEVTADNLSILAFCHDYDAQVNGHSWVSLYSPDLGMRRVEFSRARTDYEQVKMLRAGREEGWLTKYKQFESLFCPSRGYYAVGQDSCTPKSALLVPIAQDVASRLFIDARLRQLACLSGIDSPYQALPIWGRNCTLQMRDDMKTYGIDIDAMLPMQGIYLSPGDYGETFKSMPRLTDGVDVMIGATRKPRFCSKLSQLATKNSMPAYAWRPALDSKYVNSDVDFYDHLHVAHQVLVDTLFNDRAIANGCFVEIGRPKIDAFTISYSFSGRYNRSR